MVTSESKRSGSAGPALSDWMAVALKEQQQSARFLRLALNGFVVTWFGRCAADH
jgi:hypothetical protein